MINRRNIFGVLLGAPIGVAASKNDFIEKDELNLNGKTVMKFVDGHLRISPDLNSKHNSVMSLVDLDLSKNESSSLMVISSDTNEID